MFKNIQLILFLLLLVLPANAQTISPANPVGIPPTGAAGGDLSGTYPNPSVITINGNIPGGTCSVNTFVRLLSASAVPTCSQPSAANLTNGTTGTGNVVLATSPILFTPNLGVPSAITLTNGAGLPISTGVSGLGTGIATFLGTPTSANLAAAITNETGSGALVFATSPTLVTPVLGVATATSINGNIITTGTGTITLGAGKTFVISNTITLNGTDSTVFTFPSTTGTVATLAATQTFTNKTYDTAGAGNSFSINSIAVTANTGTGAVARAAGPTFTTPVLGVASATSISFGGTALGTYVEASWTPTLVGSSTPGTGQTYSSQTGYYSRIGRQVILTFGVTATSLGTAAGNIQIGNLPLAAASVTAPGYCVISFYTVAGLAATNYGVTGFITNASSVIGLAQNGNTTSSVITVAQAGATASFEGFCTYRAA